MEENKKMRTHISNKNKEVLEHYFANGMTSKGKHMKDFHTEAAKKTGLPENVIVEWIGNRNKKEQGRQYVYKKTLYRKGLSGYNMFVHENSKQLQDIKEWGGKWTSLTKEEKESYKEKAKSVVVTPDRKKAKKILLEDLHKIITELDDLGVSLSALGIDENGDQVFVGMGKTRQFFLQKPQIHAELLLYCSREKEIRDNDKKEDVSSMRKRVAAHLNQLYGKVVGKNCPFPYKNVAEGKISVSGLPDEVLPIKFPSHYGWDKLQKILNCNTLTVNSESTIMTSTVVHTCTNEEETSTSTQVTTEEANNIVQSLQNSGAELSTEQIDLLLPLLCGQSNTADEDMLPDDSSKLSRKRKCDDEDKEKDKIYHIKCILDKKKEGKRTKYLIHWEGYPAEEATWEPRGNLPNSLVHNYNKKISKLK